MLPILDPRDEPIPSGNVFEAYALTADHVLEVLNDEWQHRGRWENGKDGLGMPLGIEPEDSLLLKASEAERLEAAKHHSRRLRAYIDLWLATGRQRDSDLEIPADRRPTWRIDEIVREFDDTHRPKHFRLKDGYALSFFENVDASDLAKEHALPLPIFANTKTARKLFPNLTGAAEDAAQRMFVGTLKSDWRLKIAKCKRPECARYFLLSKQQVYKNGTFCSDCVAARRKQSAGAVTEEQRNDAEQDLYDLAARRFWRAIAKNSGWYADLKLRDRIVEYLNAQIKKREVLRRVYVARDRDGVTKKWLGWQKNREGIESKIRELKGPDAL